MQKEYTEQWGEFCKEYIAKPISALAELNVRTLNNLTQRSDYIDNFINARKLEDIINAQLKFATAANSEAVKYSQAALNILLEASSQAGKTFTNAINVGANQAGEAIRSASSKFKE